MKKMLIAAFVGGLILFIWQFLSYELVNLHKPAQQYTQKQDAILSFLENQQLPEGGYILPMAPDGSSMDEWEKLMDQATGKPWAVIQYHKVLKDNMTMNMIRGFLVNMVIIFLFCWLVGKMKMPGFSNIVSAALITGMIVFLNSPYTLFIWYEHFDIWGSFADAIVSWGLVGLWLGWWLPRHTRVPASVRDQDRIPGVD